MLYQYKPQPNDPQAGRLPYGCRLRVIQGTRRGHMVQVKDTTGEPQGLVLFASLEVLR
jgi:hypothetical protein